MLLKKIISITLTILIFCFSFTSITNAESKVIIEKNTYGWMEEFGMPEWDRVSGILSISLSDLHQEIQSQTLIQIANNKNISKDEFYKLLIEGENYGLNLKQKVANNHLDEEKALWYWKVRNGKIDWFINADIDELNKYYKPILN